MKILILFFGVLLVGCTPLRQVRFESLQSSTQNHVAKLSEKNNRNVAEEFDARNLVQGNRIETIESEIMKINGITEVEVVIIENAAILSIDLDENVKNREISKLKKHIEEKVREIDLELKYISVTTTSNFVDKLNELGGYTSS